MEIVITVASLFAPLLCLLFKLMIKSTRKKYYLYCDNDNCFENERYVYKHNKKCVELKQGATLFGRSKGADIIINDTTVSRVQFYIINDSNSCKIVNLHGVNTLYVNNKEVEDYHTLNSGDTIKAGNVKMKIINL